MHTCGKALQLQQLRIVMRMIALSTRGGALQEVWHEVLRCVSRFELLQQMELGGLSDAAIFADRSAPAAVTKVKRGFLSRSISAVSTPTGMVFMDIQEKLLRASCWAAAQGLTVVRSISEGPRAA